MTSLPLSGYTIIESSVLIEQWRTPRSRKKRIRAKWAVNPINWRPSRKALIDTSNPSHPTIYLHPQYARAFQEAMLAQEISV